MKNKPIRHKETNTFKFKRFSDRIAEIDVDVFHRVVHRNEEFDIDEESLETNFSKTLQKWNVLNLTQGFTAFKKEVRHIITLPQLINDKSLVIESLEKCLKTKDVSFIQPILDLVVALAKDLQKDFYEYFPEFLTLIIDLLATKNPDILDPAFTTLAYLFKFLWRYLVKYIDTTFKLLLPLLVDSKPEYVNNFAAESFAFVARKVRDREAFLQLVFDTLQSTPDGTSGCGKLLFEVIAGTQDQFHSCAEQMLNHYFRIFMNDSIDNQLAFGVLHQIFACITEQISPRHCQILWTVVYKILDEYTTDNNEKNVRMIEPLMRLIRQVVEHKGGRMLLDPTLLISKMVKTMSVHVDNDELLKGTIDLAASILLADNVKLSQETTYELISTLLRIENRQLLNYIVEKLINHLSFETLLLPMAMQKSVLKNEFGSEELRLFAKIVTSRAPPCLTGEHSQNFRRINLDFRAFPHDSLNHLTKILQENCGEQFNPNSLSEDAVKVLIILPHIHLQPEELTRVLQSFFHFWHDKLINHQGDDCPSLDEMEKKSLILLVTTEAAIIHNVNVDLLEKSSENNKIYFGELMTKLSHIGFIANAIDLFVTRMCPLSSELYLNISTFNTVNENMGIHLTSPDRRVRMAVCHLLSLFKNLNEIFMERNLVGLSNALEVMFMAEKVETSVYNYRDRLIHLRALSYESYAISNLKKSYRDIPLRFLLGNFYINFSLLWDPVAKVIATYANEDCTEFWPIFRKELESNNRYIVNENCDKSFKCDVLNNWMKSLKNTDKPDYLNYKVLLWKCMCEFSEYCEARNRDLTVIFINFMEDYYFKLNSETSKSFSIIKRSESNLKINEIYDDGNNDDDDDEQDGEDGDGNKQNVKEGNIMRKSGLKKLGRTSNFKLLLAQLTVFSKMQNPKMLYREPEMNKIYMEILTSKNIELQKLALDCIFAYKHKHLMPYKEHLYGLVDEKNLRNELARFRVADDQETTGMVQAEHRDTLMPILMRLVYAKMITRGTGRSAGAVGAIARRKIILRFLMGVKEEEMMLFVKMAFKPFERYGISLSINDEMEDLRMLTTNIIEQLDLSNIIPPKRLKSAANLLAIIMEEFGAKMSSNLLPRLLSILICILAQAKGILDQSGKILPGFLPTIKELRTNCIGIIARFFTHFENYNWKATELDALFDVGIFPWVDRLPVEGIHSPTTLLKLFSAWCQNPRYFCLLVKYKDDDENMTCLPYIIKLLLGEKTHSSVVNTILEMIEKLLTLQDYGVDTDERMETDEYNLPQSQPLHPRNILKVNPKAVLPGFNLNYGSAILLPHVPDILLFIKRKLEKSRIGVNRTETTILARISELNLDPKTSDTLLSLSLPILVKRAMKGESEETILELLTTIVNLMKNINDPHVHLRAILPLLNNISSLAARKLLMELLKTIAAQTKENAEIPRDIQINNVNLLMSLNAMDQRWIDQADFEKRLDAFSEIKAMVGSEDGETNSRLTLEFGVAVLYNCYYFLRHETDLSLKDSAGHCLNILGPKLARMYRLNADDRKYLIEDTILNLIRNGIRGKNDTIRMRSISFLGVMSMECSDVHPVLRDLNPLTDKSDPEVDFFENLQHLQLHRRARALLRFCSTSKTLTKTPSSKTLTQFIFPIATSYLCNESFANKNSIVDAAIDTVGTVCLLLPWHQYSIILKFYLDKLRSSNEFQRQIVRIVVAILDAFHYDLSKLHNMDKDIVDVMGRESTSTIQVSIDVEMKADDHAEVEEEKDETEDLLDVALAEASADEKVSKEVDTDRSSTNRKHDELAPLQYIMGKQIVLSPYAAKRVVFDIIHTHLPQLHRSILSRTHHEMSHKVNRKRTGSEKEEEELMRVPIALAVVKLLQKLPEGLLNKNLPGVFMKLCTFLKSRLDSVRRATREILQKIMITLGPDYLHHLLREMNSLLTKGFQIHVLAFTIHAVLTSLKPFLKPNHMNENLQSILQVCNVDLFGISGEEKDVIGITKNISEAKSTKSFDIFHVLAQFIDESCLIDLIEPLNNVLNDARSHKTVRKVVECLRHIVLGLADNSFIQNDKMLVFLYGIVSKSIPNLNSNSEKENNADEKQCDKNHIEKPDCFIIAPEPKSRTGLKTISKTAGNTNDHIMLEFGLKLFHVLLKREKVSGNTYKSYLDPFVPILANCLDSQHVKLSTLALQCLNWVLKMDLDSVRSNIKEICSSIFKILHKYGSAGLGKGDNFDLVMAAFKTMSVLVRDVKHFKMTRDQTKALVLYAEQDLHDSERQATAFNLIKAIVGRKISIPEIHEVMNKVAALSVTSESDNVRQQCRVVFYHFLMDYPLGKRLEKHLSFYLTQLSYEVQTGRLSALEMIYSIVTGFPESILVENSGLLFVMIGARLVNDEDPTCRKLAAKCLNEIIMRIPHNQRVKLFDIVLAWLKDSNVMHRRLAAQLCGIFVTIEKDLFESRLESLLPLILKQFHAIDSEEIENDEESGRFVKRKKKRKQLSKIEIKDPERVKDHHAFQVLQLTLKISANCQAFLKSEKYTDHLQSLAEYSQSLLGHPHLWVRLAATQQIGFILATIDEEKLVDILQKYELKDIVSGHKENGDNTGIKGYIYNNPVTTLRSLSLDLLAQLQPGIEFEELADQVVKNLVFIARVIKSLKCKNNVNINKDDDETATQNSISILWLLKRLRKCVNVEVTQSPKSIAVRTAAFKWTAGIITTINIDPFLKPILFQIMSPLVREMISTEESNAPLRQLSKEVAKMIKKRISQDEYMRLIAKVQQKLDIKRAERKKIQTQQFVIDPELAAKRKIARQQKKKEAKKRKKSQTRGKKFAGGKKMKKDIDIDTM